MKNLLEKCEICERSAKYKCPYCDIYYCTNKCYKSHSCLTEVEKVQ